MARIDSVLENYEKVTERLFSDKAAFSEYLKFAGKFFKLPSAQSMAVYGANPNAVMVADYDTWKKFDRQVKRGTSSIAVPYNGGLKHYFDISQTAGEKMPYQWTLDKNIAAALIEETYENEGRRFQSFAGCLNYLGAEKARANLESAINSLNISEDNCRGFEKSFKSMVQYLIAARCELGGNFKYDGTPDLSALDMLNSKAEKEKLCELVQITGKSVLLSLERSINNIIMQGRTNDYGRNQANMVRGGQDVLPRNQNGERQNVQTRPENVRVSGAAGVGSDGRGTGSDERGDRAVRGEVESVYDGELPGSDTVAARSAEMGLDTQTDRQGCYGVSGTAAETVRGEEPAPDNVHGDSGVGENAWNDDRQGDNGGHSTSISGLSGEDEKSATYGTNSQQAKAEEHSPAFSVFKAVETADKVEKISADLDKFYVNKENESVTWAYYNPDSDKGGQLVYNTFSFDQLFAALREDNVSDALLAVANTTLVDADSPEFSNRARFFLSDNEDFSFSGEWDREKLSALVEPTFTILQLKDGDDTRDHRFASLSELRERGLQAERGNYNVIYSGRLENGVTLEDIYTKFNTAIPADFRGHSLSVGDIIEIREDGKTAAHYVDDYGFEEIPDFSLEHKEDIQPETKSSTEIFKAKTAEMFTPIEGMSAGDIESDVRKYVQDILESNEIEAEIVDLAIAGSRSRDLQDEQSDLDIVIEFTSELKEDALFNILNEEPFDIGGVTVDINPIRAEETGVLGEYLEIAEKSIVENHERKQAELSKTRHIATVNSTGYFVMDKPLSYKTVSEIKGKCEKYIIAATSCSFSAEILAEFNITFLKTGRDISESYFKKDVDDIVSAMNLAEKSVLKGEKSLQFGLLGNGITVYDVSKWDKETRDYLTIAHISNEGIVKYYVDKTTLADEDVFRIENEAANTKRDFTESWEKLPIETRYLQIQDKSAELAKPQWDIFFADKTALNMEETVKKYEHALIYGDEEFPEAARTVTAYKVGDFYEVFNEDAQTAADYLNLAQTTRRGVPMAGFPAHVLDDYKRKFAMNGYYLKIGDEREIKKMILSILLYTIISKNRVFWSTTNIHRAKRSEYWWWSGCMTETVTQPRLVLRNNYAV